MGEQVDDWVRQVAEALGLVRKLEESANATARIIADNMTASESARQASGAALEATKDAATTVVALKERVVSDQAVVAAKSEHIQNAQEHADEVRANLDRALTAATASATEAEATRGRAKSAADVVDELLSAVRASKANVEISEAAIDKAKEDGDAASRALVKMATIAKEAEERVAQYEQRLIDLEKRSDAQLQAIVDLLPGATSAGLAHAFDARRQTFLTPAERWQRWFIGSLVVLAGLALSVLLPAFLASKPSTFEELGRAWLARLPFAGALIWLALHAAREAALARRLEEDYGYKSAVAASFQGFNEQMLRITEQMARSGDESRPDNPLAKLCSDTLATLASPPGRIYDKHALTMTPADKIQELIEKVLERKANEPSKQG